MAPVGAGAGDSTLGGAAATAETLEAWMVEVTGACRVGGGGIPDTITVFVIGCCWTMWVFDRTGLMGFTWLICTWLTWAVGGCP